MFRYYGKWETCQLKSRLHFSKIVHHGLITSVTGYILQQFNKVKKDFIWQGKKSKIKKSTLWIRWY